MSCLLPRLYVQPLFVVSTQYFQAEFTQSDRKIEKEVSAIVLHNTVGVWNLRYGGRSSDEDGVNKNVVALEWTTRGSACKQVLNIKTRICEFVIKDMQQV
jgi:hypothetical protein